MDLIERQAAIDAILAVTGNSSVRELYEHVQEHGLSDMWSGGVNAAIDVIIAVPSAQPEPQKRGKGDVMVSDRELQVWQNGKALIIQSRYCDDPNFTLDQEKALHEIARSFLIVNRKRESDKRRKDRAKRKQEGE